MKIKIAYHYREQEDFLRTLPEQFDSLGEVLHDGRNTVRRVEHEGKVMIVKRFRRPWLVQRIAYTFFRPTKAHRAYTSADHLTDYNFDCPLPIAYIEVKEHGLFAWGYYVAEEDTRPSCHVFNEHPEEMSDDMANDLMATIAELHAACILHGDLNLSNILYAREGKGWHFAFIDTNRTTYTLHRPTRKQVVENLWRMTHNRELGRRLFATYARLRNWKEEEFVEEVMRRIRRKERQKRWLYRLTFRKATDTQKGQKH